MASERAWVGLSRVMHAWTLLKLAVWAAFLLVAPAVCLQRGLVGAAVLLGLAAAALAASAAFAAPAVRLLAAFHDDTV